MPNGWWDSGSSPGSRSGETDSFTTFSFNHNSMITSNYSCYFHDWNF
jgi:hypothetical protein